MMLCAIDTKESQYVVVMDIPGAFLHANMRGWHMVLEGEITELVIKLEPNT